MVGREAMPQHLILRLESPLMAFGATMIDANGPTHDLPIVSMVAGLIANALGWHRGERERHQELQDRLVMGARLDRAGIELRDFQTALLQASDKGWTTRGAPEGRAGGANTYKSPHIRKRHYRADALVTVAMRLDPPDGAPTLADLAAALVAPARPLFIGRKPCLPSRPIAAEPMVEAANVYEALRRAPAPPKPAWAKNDREPLRVVLPPTEWPRDRPVRTRAVPDVRDWVAGVHAGENRLDVFSVDRSEFPTLDEEALP